jgi:CheY-like chemotaxis protein
MPAVAAGMYLITTKTGSTVMSNDFSKYNFTLNEAAIQAADELSKTLIDSEQLKALRPMNSKFNVIIADDYPAGIKMLGLYVGQAGYTYTSATDGEAVLAAYKEREIDFIFTDVDMPLKNGLEVTALIREYEQMYKKRKCVIIGHTGFGKLAVSDCFAAGMDGVVYKPFYDYWTIESLLAHFLHDRSTLTYIKKEKGV